MGKPCALEKKEKSKGSLDKPSEKRAPREPREKKWTGPRYFGTARNKEEILKKFTKELAGIQTAQGSMLMGIRNEERHVLSVAYNSEEKVWKQMETQELVPDDGKLGTSGKA